MPLMDLGQEIANRLDVLPPRLFVPKKAETGENAAKAVLNEEFISSSYFQALKMERCASNLKAAKLRPLVSLAAGPMTFPA